MLKSYWQNHWKVLGYICRETHLDFYFLSQGYYQSFGIDVYLNELTLSSQALSPSRRLPSPCSYFSFYVFAVPVLLKSECFPCGVFVKLLKLFICDLKSHDGGVHFLL